MPMPGRIKRKGRHKAGPSQFLTYPPKCLVPAAPEAIVEAKLDEVDLLRDVSIDGATAHSLANRQCHCRRTRRAGTEAEALGVEVHVIVLDLRGPVRCEGVFHARAN